jgi:hypothetical protein
LIAVSSVAHTDPATAPQNVAAGGTAHSPLPGCSVKSTTVTASESSDSTVGDSASCATATNQHNTQTRIPPPRAAAIAHKCWRIPSRYRRGGARKQTNTHTKQEREKTSTHLLCHREVLLHQRHPRHVPAATPHAPALSHSKRNGCLIGAPWLVTGGHGASLKRKGCVFCGCHPRQPPHQLHVLLDTPLYTTTPS